MSPQRIYIFFSRFGLKTGLHFAHFGLESGIVFDGTTGVYELICYFSSEMNTDKLKSKPTNSKWIGRRFEEQGDTNQRELTQSVCVTITSKFPIYVV